VVEDKTKIKIEIGSVSIRPLRMSLRTLYVILMLRFLAVLVLEEQGSKRRDNLAYESNASYMRKALSIMAVRG
jgi:hypothetical protein